MGCPTHLRNLLCLPLKELKTLYHICKFPAYKYGLFLLKLKVSLIVRDNELDLQNVHEGPKIEHLLFRNKRNQTQSIKRKWKSFTETLEGKEKWFIARHEYEKRRTVNESEESKEKRLVQQHLNRRKKHANESSKSRKKRLAIQSQCQRQKIANESAECREERMLINKCQYQNEKIANGITEKQNVEKRDC